MRDEECAQQINRTHENTRYLPSIQLPRAIRATTDIKQALQVADYVLWVVPAQALYDLAGSFQEFLKPGALLINCAKGIDRTTLALPGDNLKAACPGHIVMALSGPSFAREVASGKPTALVLAGEDTAECLKAQYILSGQTLRVYASADRIGVELCGALKNVIALGAGIAIGAGLGENARAALVTRGISELGRLTQALGGKLETVHGLAGIGDLTLTAMSSTSRNTAYGLAIGAGEPPPAKLAEGVHTVEAACKLAEKHGLSLPITTAIAAILRKEIAIETAIKELLQRPLKNE